MLRSLLTRVERVFSLEAGLRTLKQSRLLDVGRVAFPPTWNAGGYAR